MSQVQIWVVLFAFGPKKKEEKGKKKNMKNRGIDHRSSRMLSGRSII